MSGSSSQDFSMAGYKKLWEEGEPMPWANSHVRTNDQRRPTTDELQRLVNNVSAMPLAARMIEWQALGLTGAQVETQVKHWHLERSGAIARFEDWLGRPTDLPARLVAMWLADTDETLTEEERDGLMPERVRHLLATGERVYRL